MRVVIDTNVWVSYLISPGEVLRQVVAHLTQHETILYSPDVLEELLEVLLRPKFSRILDMQIIRDFSAGIEAIAEYVEVSERIQASADPDDNKFLELAIAGSADLIVSGDSDLIDLHPFRGIDIKSPAQLFQILPISGN